MLKALAAILILAGLSACGLEKMHGLSPNAPDSYPTKPDNDDKDD